MNILKYPLLTSPRTNSSLTHGNIGYEFNSGVMTPTVLLLLLILITFITVNMRRLNLFR